MPQIFPSLGAATFYYQCPDVQEMNEVMHFTYWSVLYVIVQTDPHFKQINTQQLLFSLWCMTISIH